MNGVKKIDYASFVVSTNNERQLEKLVLLNIIGIVNSLKENLITIEEAEKIIFSPYVMDLANTKGLSKELIDIIHMGTELEDIESLIPEQLDESLDQIKNKSNKLLQKRKKYRIENKILSSG